MSSRSLGTLASAGRWALLAAAVFLLLANVLPTVAKLRDTRSRAEQTRRRNANMQANLERLRVQKKALETDPYTVERALRKTLHVSKDGEEILKPARAPVSGAKPPAPGDGLQQK